MLQSPEQDADMGGISDASFCLPEPEGEAARSESSLSTYVAACRSVADHLFAPVSPPLAPEGPSETSPSGKAQRATEGTPACAAPVWNQAPDKKAVEVVVFFGLKIGRTRLRACLRPSLRNGHRK